MHELQPHHGRVELRDWTHDSRPAILAGAEVKSGACDRRESTNPCDRRESTNRRESISQRKSIEMTLGTDDIDVQEILRQAGWFPGRTVTVDSFRACIGDRWTGRGHRILAEYGGLVLRWAASVDRSGRSGFGRISFEPCKTLLGVRIPYLERCERSWGSRLCCVGEFGAWPTYLDAAGCVVCDNESEDRLVLVGESMDDALNRYVQNGGFLRGVAIV